MNELINKLEELIKASYTQIEYNRRTREKYDYILSFISRRKLNAEMQNDIKIYLNEDVEGRLTSVDDYFNEPLESLIELSQDLERRKGE